jgi:hypothetical protein
MKAEWIRRLPPAWQARVIRWRFNWHPAYRSTGGRVDYVSPDVTRIRVRLPLTRRTRNVVGSLFGGSLFAMTDGPHPTLLMWALGPDYIVWDKNASIRYRKPGRGTLYADFHIPLEEIQRIRMALKTSPELDCTYVVELKDDEGQVHAIVERTLYIAIKHQYKKKLSEGRQK